MRDEAHTEARSQPHGKAQAQAGGQGRAAVGWTVVRPREYHIRVVRGRPVFAGPGSVPDISDEATMEIRFPAGAPAYRDSNLTVVFSALVDGEPVPCAISVEALEDHFGAHTENEEGWMRAFDAGRPRIEAVAREHLQISNGTPVLLKSGHFPPGNVAG
ncbi:DUF1488 domain-containing protein [Paraburkholderia phenoliruptrix]|uniref:DUF1488 family protein n=2 Tax=Paraburkholderia phenoliruptrix TaxID=252970 RepID=K0DPU8_9BURK|nr:hypothetical protein BUPH_06602 [Paraburkholderia phenoliruptrix BR3459a]